MGVGQLSNRSKGSRNELKAVKELEAEGWIVYRVPPSRKWQIKQDIYEKFDIVAKKDRHTLWIQVKTNKTPPLQPFIDFKNKYCSEFEDVEIWNYRDYKKCKKVIV